MKIRTLEADVSHALPLSHSKDTMRTHKLFVNRSPKR
jgi:hypothetical protein